MEWYVEYERLLPVAGGTEGQDLRLSGHQLRLDKHVEELRYPFERTTVNDFPAWTHAGSDGPAMVVMAVEDDRTMLLLSYALTLAELRAIAETDVRFARESEWVHATGEQRSVE